MVDEHVAVAWLWRRGREYGMAPFFFLPVLDGRGMDHGRMEV